MIKKANILIIENDHSIIKALETLLANEYLLHYATTGKQALKQLENHSNFELLISALVLPDINGYKLCKEFKKTEQYQDTPIIFICSKNDETNEEQEIDLGVIDYINPPFDRLTLLVRIKNCLRLASLTKELEASTQLPAVELENNQTKLQRPSNTFQTYEVSTGVFWLQIPDANLNILCGCPGDIMKHLIRKGFVKTISENGITYESGPNAILLSDQLVQNGDFVNLSEFPVLHMLYRQGMMIPSHPNNTGAKPLLIGCCEQVKAQMEYIHRGNYGLTLEEASNCDINPITLDYIFRIKSKFSYGKIHSPSHFVDALTINIDNFDTIPIRNGANIKRIGFNHFRFEYLNHSAEINLNIDTNSSYDNAYSLGQYHFNQYYFAIIHSGEGNGWDVNRPSMASIIMFQGKIYLIDAGPGISQSLVSLGIDISEVEGIFHTHAHDDHFAGLPALIHSERRLKYFATALVRKSVTKKLSALMSFKEELFDEFFELHDLIFDKWNDCNGLEVKPLYSPHPVENNILLFRAQDSNNYKTYAHWADISSFSMLDGMVGGKTDDVPLSFINKIKNDYLCYADLKKIDIGGGDIHGTASDFNDDPSKTLMLAHIDRKLTIQEMEIGSETSFGALDILIKGKKDYLRQHAFYCLSHFFPNVSNVQLQTLLNCPILKINAGSIVLRANEVPESIGMILSGTVAYLDSTSAIKNHLVLGSLIGVDALFENFSENYTYRTISNSQIMYFPISLIKAFLEKNNLLSEMEILFSQALFLRRTWLFGEQTSSATLTEIARSMQILSFSDGESFNVSNEDALFLIKEGLVQVITKNKRSIEALNSGDVFGRFIKLSCPDNSQQYTAKGDVQIYQFELNRLLNIPIIHWKILELCEKRKILWHTEK